MAAEQVDKYLTWGEPPADVAAKLEVVHDLADKAGRQVSFGITLRVIVRELVLPKLPLGHPLRSAAAAVNMGPFGETVAGDHRPVRTSAAQS